MTRRFIEEGNRVKVTMFMRGRQVTKHEIASEVLTQFITDLADIAKPESPPKFEGANNISVVLVKKK